MRLERKRCLALYKYLDEHRPDLLENEAFDTIDDFTEILGQMERARQALRAKLRERLKTLSEDHPMKSAHGILGPINLGRVAEPIHTRLIAWFIDPKGTHGFGDRVARALLRHTKCNFRARNFKVENVEAEALMGDRLDSRDRIDIKVSGRSESKPWLLYIEAKLNSPEGDKQLARYEAKLPKDGVYLIYLSPYGTAPSTSKKRDWITLSYAQLVQLLWESTKMLSDKQGYPIMRFYLAGILRDVLDVPLTAGSGSADLRGLPYSLLGLFKS
ncbi:MAG: PD-(D/E)XK nuclease family protein [Pseudomonadota bacterium]